ncbi:hypothetical protein BGW37DRAFT_483980 [Umbelopsis sp. PMI_123]|nr:hypothetical protein BGW37DRAFT_483980 [Umbelopsis sp. PMI_123]
MRENQILAISASLQLQWLSLPRNKHAASTPVTSEQEVLVRQLAAQLTDANLIPVSNNVFEQQLARESNRVLVYEDRELLDLALEYVPLAQLYEDAETDLEQYPDWGLEDIVIIKLLAWFKSFFLWVDQPPCQFCSSPTTAIGRGKPNLDDIRNGASVVEVYQCRQCRQLTRFPRYNNPAKLLKTRRGRCGEWANCFTLCCRAVGAEARYILDTTDHVWTEIYSQAQQRWVHCDPCENAFDRPLLYSAGWGKSLSYCIAFSAEEVIDVTKRYTTNWPVILTRRHATSEPQLEKLIHNLTERRYGNLPASRLEELKNRRIKEEDELVKLSKRVTARDDELIGRISGSLDWRLARNEINHTKELDAGLMSELPSYRSVAAVESDSFSLQGSATIHTASCGSSFVASKECIQLTPALTSQTGSAFVRSKVSLERHEGIVVDFAFKIANENDGKADGADGLAFVIQSFAENALGSGGCDLGYGGLRKSIAVEFDTYDSSDRCADPSGNHISVHGRLPPHSNSAHHMHSHGHTSNIPPMNSGTWLYARIHLLIKRQAIIVSFSDEGNEQSGEGSKFETVLSIKNIDIREYLGGDIEAWVGFTASTGGLSQSHQVKLGSVNYLARDSSIKQ